MSRKLTIEEFIEKSDKIHVYKYDYSKFIYKNHGTKGIIICPSHGEFLQTPNHHINGQGCYHCGLNRMKRLQRSNTEEFIKESSKLHGDIFDYSKVNYINARTNVTIICKTHGEFQQTPEKHLLGRGCQECGLEWSMSNNRWERKPYTFPNGKKVKVQGYECWTLDFLISSSLQEDDIKVDTKDKPKIFYNWNGQSKRYYPDCYISSSNTIVETKSDWTWNMEVEKNEAKITGSLQCGHDVRFIIWGHNKRLISDATYKA